MEKNLELLLKKGAEAEIWKGKWLGMEAVFKIRKSKPWRHPILDSKILKSRTLKEARIMYSAYKKGIPIPFIYDVDVDEYIIVMEYVKGMTLKDYLEKFEDHRIFERLGEIIANLHNSSIVHGDLTPSNVILRNDGLFILDFGLAEFSNRIEDMGIDLHLLLRSLESSFSSIAKNCFESFMKGYSKFKENQREILEKLREIRRRGRYVAERRYSRRF